MLEFVINNMILTFRGESKEDIIEQVKNFCRMYHVKVLKCVINPWCGKLQASVKFEMRGN